MSYNGGSPNRGQTDNAYNPQRRQTSTTAKPSRTTNNRNNGYDSEDYDYAEWVLKQLKLHCLKTNVSQFNHIVINLIVYII